MQSEGELLLRSNNFLAHLFYISIQGKVSILQTIDSIQFSIQTTEHFHMKSHLILTVITHVICSFDLLSCPPDEQLNTTEPKREIDSKLPEKPREIVSSLPPSPFVDKRGPHILVLGGGGSPSGNQISLESNVKYFRKISNAVGLGNATVSTYFADGKENGRDIQFFDPNYLVPEINLIMAELFGKTKGLANQYRSNQLKPDGSSSIANIDQWFNQRKKSTFSGKNLIYFTGHGGKGDNKTPHNTTAYLWSNNRLKVNELVKKLDQLPIKQSTLLVMVQCYSGGFANVIFENGDPSKGVSKHSRAGFFSTTQTRVAAGCTPDIREENYQEYSTSFWEALSGFSRMGKKISQPDYNEDGTISLMEAHSYVCINSNTIDIPIKTSDILLRKFLPNQFSTKPTRNKVSELIDKYLPKVFKKDSNGTNTEEINLLESFSKSILSERANPEEKAVLFNLSKILALQEDFPGKEIKSIQEDLKKEKEAVLKEKKKATEQKNKYTNELRKKLISRYPECSNPFHPTTTLLLSTHQKKGVINLVNEKELWKKLVEEKEIIKGHESKRFLIEKKEVKIMRLRRCIENIILAHTLTEYGSEIQKKQYNALLKLERSTF